MRRFCSPTSPPTCSCDGAGTGGLSVWHDKAHFAIGLIRDRAGRVIACERSTRKLSALAPDGGRTVLSRSHEGRVLNSTYDMICGADVAVLFTDPPFGVRRLEGALHGYQPAQELPGSWVFAVGPDADSPGPLATGISRPNGLCLLPDERVLYASDSSERFHKVVALEVGPGWALGAPRDFAVLPAGLPDGMPADADGDLRGAAGACVRPRRRARRPCAGARDGHDCRVRGADLYITTTTCRYRIRTAMRSGRAR